MRIEKAMLNPASHTANTIKNALASTASLVFQIRIRSAGCASTNGENVFRLASRPMVVSAMMVKPKNSSDAT